MKIKVSDLVHFGNLDFLAKKAVEGFITGLHKSPYNGFSVEFAEHKQFNIGDSTRHIDWKVFGRTDKLYLKNYEDETNMRCHFVIDASSSMYYPTETHAKIKFACLATASLCYLIQKQRDAIGMMSFSDKTEIYSSSKSSKLHLHQIWEKLESVMSKKSELQKTALVQNLRDLVYKLKKRGIIILFTDMFENTDSWDEIFPALQHLKYQKHEIILFNVLDKSTELNFNFESRPHLFIDKETGIQIKVNPTEIKDQYQKLAADRQKELYLKCSQYKIDLVEVDVDQPIEQVLQGYMIKRGVMGRK